MSTRCSVVIKDEFETLYFYRHSDGYPENGAGDDLKDFVKGYKEGSMRTSAMQSGGWLIVRGHREYLDSDKTTFKPNTEDKFGGWKVGAYEPSSSLAPDAAYVYVIDLNNSVLEMRETAWRWDEEASICKTKLIKSVSFKSKKNRID